MVHRLLVLIASTVVGGLWHQHRHTIIDLITDQIFHLLHRDHDSGHHGRGRTPW